MLTNNDAGKILVKLSQKRLIQANLTHKKLQSVGFTHNALT